MRPIVALAFIAVVVSMTRSSTADGGQAWSDVPERERQTLTRLLDSPHWPFRVFAINRLERFSGDDIAPLVRARVADETWQVRCFALRGAQRMGITVAPETLADEQDGRVIRAALTHGVPLEGARIEKGVRALLRTRALDELLLGLEIAAAIDVDDLRAEATRRLRRLIRNMDDGVAVRITPQIARIVGTDPAPQTADGWRTWLAGRADADVLPPPVSRIDPGRPLDVPLVAAMEAETFSRLIDYLDSLRQEDLDLVVVMDSTWSMIPMINEARAGVEDLIIFLDDLSRTMRIAFVAYRDADNPPEWEGHPFTTNVASVRDFLFSLKITAGRDLPEAVLEGLTACGRLDWMRGARRQIILVGDARPHDEDGYRLTSLLESYRSRDVVVHTVHVPMKLNDEYVSQMTPDRARAYAAEIDEHNRRTANAFVEIARLGAGESVRINRAPELVPSMMHLTIEEPWWPAFDEFYALYLELCR